MRSIIILCALGLAGSAVAAQPKEDPKKSEARAAEQLRTQPQRASQVSTPEPAKNDDEAERAIGDIVTTPLQDTNLKKKRIPEVLELARGGPYEMTGLSNCALINRNIAALSGVLGTDFDTPEDRRPNRGRQAASVGKSIVESFIPFRGVIREASGAAAAQREWDAAVDAGIARRGFLRGVARSRGCRATG
ncbi:MAG: hypothetical protein ACOYLK_06590 [Sphingomonas sp.]